MDMAEAVTPENASLIPGTVMFSDSGVLLTEVEFWQDGGASFIRSTEFPFLVAAGDSKQDAVNTLVYNADEFIQEVYEMGLDEATKPEIEAAMELMGRFTEGFKAIEERRRKRFVSIYVGRMRRAMRGVWRPQSPVSHERSGQASLA